MPYNLRTPDVWKRALAARTTSSGQGRGGWLVAPGTTQATAKLGRVRLDSLDHVAARRGFESQLTQARTRDRGASWSGGRMPKRVTIDGQGDSSARSRSRRYARSARGWIVKSGTLPGVVLKLAPSGGRSTVELAFELATVARRLESGSRGRRLRPRRGRPRRRSGSWRPRRDTRRAPARGAPAARAPARAPGSGCRRRAAAGKAPPKRGLTSVTGSEPSGSRKHWMHAGPTMPIVSATLAAVLDQLARRGSTCP